MGPDLFLVFPAIGSIPKRATSSDSSVPVQKIAVQADNEGYHNGLAASRHRNWSSCRKEALAAQMVFAVIIEQSKLTVTATKKHDIDYSSSSTKALFSALKLL